MLQSLVRCEIGKENQILPYSDAIILGSDPQFYNAFLVELNKFHHHFPGISLAYCEPVSGKSQLLDIIRFCLQRGTVPVVVGLPHRELEELSNYFSEVFILTNKISGPANNLVRHYLGFQRHLSPIEDIHAMEQHSLDSTSLGLLTQDLLQMEPVLRNAQSVHMDFNVCKSSILPSWPGCQPTGLLPEELIQLVRYAAHSPRLKMLSFENNSVAELSGDKSPAILLAECVWYFFEGLWMGSYQVDAADEHMYVNLRDFEEVLEFAYSSKTDKWWVRIKTSEELAYLPCTENDYLHCSSGSLPSKLQTRLFEGQALT
ncbi:MAG: hypothetical protein IPN29_18630 [Saprospiraceae bacterium]|nr:hypothetical protein [Saprospiraceae bacterium]